MKRVMNVYLRWEDIDKIEKRGEVTYGGDTYALFAEATYDTSKFRCIISRDNSCCWLESQQGIQK